MSSNANIREYATELAGILRRVADLQEEASELGVNTYVVELQVVPPKQGRYTFADALALARAEGAAIATADMAKSVKRSAYAPDRELEMRMSDIIRHVLLAADRCREAFKRCKKKLEDPTTG